jgi:uncharacterized membrane protein
MLPADRPRSAHPAADDRSAHSGERRAGSRPPPTPVTAVVERNITALVAQRRLAEAQRAPQDRVVDVVTRFTGSLPFVWIHLALFGAWIAVNVGLVPGVPRFDPSLVTLAMIASVEAIFLSTFVLISQNRMQALADRRADLDLQVSLLAEHEVTEVLALVREIARRMDIEQARAPELDELTQDIRPEVVLAHMEATERKLERQDEAALDATVAQLDHEESAAPVARSASSGR